jgi:hypothetical protein
VTALRDGCRVTSRYACEELDEYVDRCVVVEDVAVVAVVVVVVDVAAEDA